MSFFLFLLFNIRFILCSDFLLNREWLLSLDNTWLLDNHKLLFMWEKLKGFSWHKVELIIYEISYDCPFWFFFWKGRHWYSILRHAHIILSSDLLETVLYWIFVVLCPQHIFWLLVNIEVLLAHESLTCLRVQSLERKSIFDCPQNDCLVVKSAFIDGLSQVQKSTKKNNYKLMN